MGAAQGELDEAQDHDMGEGQPPRDAIRTLGGDVSTVWTKHATPTVQEVQEVLQRYTPAQAWSAFKGKTRLKVHCV